MLERIPWRDRAKLVRIIDVDGAPLATGDLLSIVYRLDMTRREMWPDYCITLPDRGEPPCAYDAASFDRLVRKRPRI